MASYENKYDNNFSNSILNIDCQVNFDENTIFVVKVKKATSGGEMWLFLG